jgi:putative hydrolase of the HAD superfamily
MTNATPLRQATAGPLDPTSVETWIFDLDNTLYPARSNLFAQVSARMTLFIQDRFGLEAGPARDLQRDLFRRHGTTLRGLMSEHAVDPEGFLAYVHDIDVSPVDPSPRLDALLAALPGRKMVFTNGSVPHAERVMARLGIARHFDTVFDIVAAGYVPKPDPRPYAQLVEIGRFAPARAVMIEDMAKNLAPAAALGMRTVWLQSEHDWACDGADADHVHHVAEDVIAFLETLVRVVPEASLEAPLEAR